MLRTFARRLLLAELVILFVVILAVINAFAQQPPTPCEEVRGMLATNWSELMTQRRALERENGELRAKLAEMEKKLGNGKDAPAFDKK